MNTFTVNYESPPPPYYNSVSPSSQSRSVTPQTRPKGTRRKTSSLKYLAVTVFILFSLSSYLIYRFFIAPTYHKENKTQSGTNLTAPSMSSEKNSLSPPKAVSEGVTSMGHGDSPAKKKPAKPAAGPEKTKNKDVKNKDKDKDKVDEVDVDNLEEDMDGEKEEEIVEPKKEDKKKGKGKTADKKKGVDEDADKATHKSADKEKGMTGDTGEVDDKEKEKAKAKEKEKEKDMDDNVLTPKTLAKPAATTSDNVSTDVSPSPNPNPDD